MLPQRERERVKEMIDDKKVRLLELTFVLLQFMGND